MIEKNIQKGDVLYIEYENYSSIHPDRYVYLINSVSNDLDNYWAIVTVIDCTETLRIGEDFLCFGEFPFGSFNEAIDHWNI